MTQNLRCEHGLDPHNCRKCAQAVQNILAHHFTEEMLQRFGMPKRPSRTGLNEHTMVTGDTVTGTSTYHGLRGTRPECVVVDDLIPEDGPMTEEEMHHGPLPPWAIGYAKGEYVLGAQLPTRDGRRCGNAHIIDQSVEPVHGQTVFQILTDAGSDMRLLASEIYELFYPPVWVSDVGEVIRKFGRNQ